MTHIQNPRTKKILQDMQRRIATILDGTGGGSEARGPGEETRTTGYCAENA